MLQNNSASLKRTHSVTERTHSMTLPTKQGIYIYIYIYMHVYMHACMYVCISIYVELSICMYVCMYVCTRIRSFREHLLWHLLRMLTLHLLRANTFFQRTPSLTLATYADAASLESEYVLSENTFFDTCYCTACYAGCGRRAEHTRPFLCWRMLTYADVC